jgi:hypothetical protein
MAMSKCEDRQIKFCISQTNYKHYEGGYGKLSLGNVYTWHDFFQECANLKKLIPKHFFTSLMKDLLMEVLVTLSNLLSIKFMELGE